MKRNRNMHEKVSPFVSKTLSKITTIIYISTKISGFKNSCNEKKGVYFLTVKNDTVNQKFAKYAMKKINLHLKRFTLMLFLLFYTNIRNSIARHNTDSRLVSLSKCVIFKFRSISEERQRVSMQWGKSQVSSMNIIEPSMCTSFKQNM